MRKRFVNGLVIAFLAIFISCGACFANLLSVFPEPTAEEAGSYFRFSFRTENASKLIEDLYPLKFLEAIEPLSKSMELEPLVKMSNIIKALSKSNIREFASFAVIDDDFDLYNGGMVVSVPGGEKILKKAVESGKLTLFDLISSLGEPILEALKAFDEDNPIEDFVFIRDKDGLFFYENYHVCIEEDKIIIFETKEETLSVAKAMKSGVKTKETDSNVILVYVPKGIVNTTEDIRAELGISYENSIWRIKAISNVSRVMSNTKILEGERLEKALRVLETIPMIGKGDPFIISGGNTFLDEGLDSIEEQLMSTGDMTLTLNWAMFLQAVNQFGISKKDLGNLLTESATMLFGLDTKIFEIPLPLGGYIAFTGRENAAAKIISAIYNAIAEMQIAEEKKVEGWNKVYAITINPGISKALLAQKGETLLFGLMEPDDLNIKLDLKKVGITNERMLSWLIINTEKIWKSARSAYLPVSAMIMSGLFGNVSDSEKEAVQFFQHLLKTDLPMSSLNIWFSSIEEFEINLIMNPSPVGDFWRVLFEWVAKMMDDA